MRHHSTVTIKKIDAKSHTFIEQSPARYGKTMGNGEHSFKMISDVEYCRALKHGFDGGDPLDDWLMAEEEMNHMQYSSVELGN